MKVLVANLGSTSFKYRLFDMSAELSTRQRTAQARNSLGSSARQLARGGVERIGSASSPCTVQIGDYQGAMEMSVPHHGVAVRACIGQLTDPATWMFAERRGDCCDRLQGRARRAACKVSFASTKKCSTAMDEVTSVAPAHNPPYLAAMRQLAATVPDIPLVAAFETDFHSHDTRSSASLCTAQGLGRCVADSQVGLSWCQSSLHRACAVANCWDATMRESSRVTWVDRAACARSRRQERGHHDGDEPTDWLTAEQSRGRPRSVLLADAHAAYRDELGADAGGPCQPKLDCWACRVASVATFAIWKRPLPTGQCGRAATRWTSTWPRSVGIWVACSSPSVAAMHWCSPAASVKTGVRFAQRSVQGLEELGFALDATKNQTLQRGIATRMRTAAAVKFGLFPPTKNSLSRDKRSPHWGVRQSSKRCSHVCCQSNRLDRFDRKSRIDARPKAAGRRTLSARRGARQVDHHRSHLCRRRYARCRTSTTLC